MRAGCGGGIRKSRARPVGAVEGRGRRRMYGNGSMSVNRRKIRILLALRCGSSRTARTRLSRTGWWRFSAWLRRPDLARDWPEARSEMLAIPGQDATGFAVKRVRTAKSRSHRLISESPAIQEPRIPFEIADRGVCSMRLSQSCVGGRGGVVFLAAAEEPVPEAAFLLWLRWWRGQLGRQGIGRVRDRGGSGRRRFGDRR